MAKAIRLAILECDTPVPTVKAQYGSYGEIFRRRLTAGIEALRSQGDDIDLEISTWDAVASNLPALETIDALLISGSKHTAYHDEPWIVSLVHFVKKAYESRIPIVGICFGHQIIGRSLGGKLGASQGGWEISVSRIDLSSDGKQLFGTDELKLHQMHKDAVLEVPAGLLSLGGSPSCGIQGLYEAGHIFSLQAHPEFDDFVMKNLIKMRREQGIFDGALSEDGISRAETAHDGARLFLVILKFLAARLEPYCPDSIL